MCDLHLWLSTLSVKPVYEIQYKSSYLLEPNELDGLSLLHPTLRPFNEMGPWKQCLFDNNLTLVNPRTIREWDLGRLLMEIERHIGDNKLEVKRRKKDRT